MKQKPVSEVIRTRTSEIWLGEDGIVYDIIALPRTIMKVEDIRENMKAITQVTGNRPALILSDIRLVKVTDNEARAYGASHEISQFITALAILVDAPFSRLFGNLFLRFNRPPYPARLFTDESAALEWLREFAYLLSEKNA